MLKLKIIQHINSYSGILETMENHLLFSISRLLKPNFNFSKSTTENHKFGMINTLDTVI